MIVSTIKKIRNFILSSSANLIVLLGFAVVTYVVVEQPSDYLAKVVYNIKKERSTVAIFIEEERQNIEEVINRIVENMADKSSSQLSYSDKLNNYDIIITKNYNCLRLLDVNGYTEPSSNCNKIVSNFVVIPISGLITYKFPSSFLFNNQLFSFNLNGEKYYIAINNNKYTNLIHNIFDILANINNTKN